MEPLSCFARTNDGMRVHSHLSKRFFLAANMPHKIQWSLVDTIFMGTGIPFISSKNHINRAKIRCTYGVLDGEKKQRILPKNVLSGIVSTSFHCTQAWRKLVSFWSIDFSAALAKTVYALLLRCPQSKVALQCYKKYIAVLQVLLQEYAGHRCW